jgi:hypothetical protein
MAVMFQGVQDEVDDKILSGFLDALAPIENSVLQRAQCLWLVLLLLGAEVIGLAACCPVFWHLVYFSTKTQFFVEAFKFSPVAVSTAQVMLCSRSRVAALFCLLLAPFGVTGKLLSHAA